jgi:hypothetical protein
MTPEQIARGVIARGFADPARATAVVLGESGGDTGLVSGRNADGTFDSGAWQINSGHFPGGKYDRGLIDQAGALDWQRSTDFAYALSKGGNDFGAWSATRRSSFPGHLATADQAVAAVRATAPGASTASAASAGGGPQGFGLPPWLDPRNIPGAGAVTGIAGGAKELFELAARILSTLLDRDFWRRLALFNLGLAGVVLGIIIWRRKDVAAAAGTAVAGPAGGIAASAAV